MKIISYFQFIFKKRKYILLFGIISFIAIAWWVNATNGKPIDATQPTLSEELGWWAKWADPIIGMGTFILALIISVIQLIEDWEESLPKRLTVYFKFAERDVMICHKAHLAAEGDIRNLGQQIGGQMAKVRFLDFKANDIESKRVAVEKNLFHNNQYFVHYEVKFELTKLPKADHREKDTEVLHHIDQFKTHNLIWHEPDNNILKKKEEWKIVKQHKQAEEIDSSTENII